MPIPIAFIGRKGSGMSEVVGEMITALKTKGYRIGVLKHLAKPTVEIDTPGKDTHQMRAHGAEKVILSGRTKRAVFEDLSAQTPLEEDLAAFTDFDVVFLLGYFTENIPTVEVYREEAGSPLSNNMKNAVALFAASGYQEPHTFISNSMVCCKKIRELENYLLCHFLSGGSSKEAAC